ncbi:uncharacterized protein LOC144433041 [Glandiceps talaboti]
MVIDSGASSNLIDKELWNKLKKKKIKCIDCTWGATKKLYAYGSSKPLEIIGSFTAVTKWADTEVKTEFFVIDGEGEPLLGKDTAIQLGVLRLGANINAIRSEAAVVDEYRDVFKGVGKLKEYQVKLHIDPDVTPVAQPVRRTPFSLRQKVKAKVDELIEMDIIEPVDGPTPWVSPVVVVPKPNGEIRLCVDMRQAMKQ